MSFDFSDPYLRIFPRPKPLLDHQDVPFFGGLPELLRSAKELSGREIVFVRAGGKMPEEGLFHCPVRLNEQKTIGFLVLAPKRSKKRTAADEKAERFLHALADFLADAYRWQYAVRQLEDIAATRPISLPHSNEASPFTMIPIAAVATYRRDDQLLRNILKEAARLIGCCAASLHLLNERERTLKLRSCWGLAEERLLDPPRPLNRSMADLEAMLGHAVVINDAFSKESWESPDPFTSSVCVPVASASSIFGTAWFHAEEDRDFDGRELGYLEMVASRIAVELELRENKEAQLQTS